MVLGTVHLPLIIRSELFSRFRLGSGTPSAHETTYLRLLPSGPDRVHKHSLRRTRPSTPMNGNQSSHLMTA